MEQEAPALQIPGDGSVSVKPLNKTIQSLSPDLGKNDLVLMKITGQDVQVQYKGKGDKLVKKNIYLEDLAEALTSTVKMDTGILKLSGSNYIGVKQYIKSGANELIVLEASSSIRPIKLVLTDGVRTVQAATPYALLFAIIQKDAMRASEVYSSIYPIMAENTRLYKFPFGNAWADGRICWGNIPFSKNGEKFNLLTSFLESEFNNHLGFYYGQTNNGEQIRAIDRLATEIEGTTIFNTGNLLSAGVTYQSVKEKLLNDHFNN